MKAKSALCLALQPKELKTQKDELPRDIPWPDEIAADGGIQRCVKSLVSLLQLLYSKRVACNERKVLFGVHAIISRVLAANNPRVLRLLEDFMGGCLDPVQGGVSGCRWAVCRFRFKATCLR